MQVTQRETPDFAINTAFGSLPGGTTGPAGLGPDIIPGALHATLPDESREESSGTPSGISAKPKQKRNKPTLSCLECVERKTKCDRGRPCLACVKRQGNCEYTAVANIIATADRNNGTKKARCITKPAAKIRKTSTSSSIVTSPVNTDNGWVRIDNRAHRKSMSSNGSSPYLLSNMPYTKSSPSNVFGVGSQHPFSSAYKSHVPIMSLSDTCANHIPKTTGPAKVACLR